MMSLHRKQTNPKRRLYLQAFFEAFLKLDPRHQICHPVMFAIELISLFLAGLWLWTLVGGANGRVEIVAGVVALWLGLTVLFTNFADALAEGRREAQADSLHHNGREIKIKWLKLPPPRD
jgi:K+-transporting ATPase ATPase B chain